MRLGLDDLVLGILDALVIHPEELLHEGLADLLEVAQGEVGLVELAVFEALPDDRRDHRPDRGLVALDERAYRRLDAIGEHEDGGLLALRLGADMAVGRRIDVVWPAGLGPAFPLARAGEACEA